MVLAPENPLVDRLTTKEQSAEVAQYRAQISAKSDLERTDLAKEKSGVFTGAYAINPASNERIPIWIADYVLMGYGTGAIMGVPAHDERDLEFAQKFGLEIRQVVRTSQSAAPADPGSAPASGAGFGASPKQSFPSGTAPEEVREGEARALPRAAIHSLPILNDGIAINSPLIEGLTTPEAKERITAWLEERGLGRRTINYKLRDWLFSRQRYWGEPFPIIWREGKHEAIPESELPLVPPPLDDFKPTGTGEPPLARAREWVRYSETATRELNTMPQWAGSCWYYLRFCDPGNRERFVGQEAERYWMGRGNDESRMANAEGMTKPEATTVHSKLIRISTFDIRHSRRSRAAESISTSAAPSTRCCICFTPASGTRCSSISATSRPPSRSSAS